MTSKDNQTTVQLICIGGIPATGKTTVGNALKSQLGDNYKIICPDQIRLEVLGVNEGRITNEDLSKELTLKVIDQMYIQAENLLNEGLNVIVPSAFILEKMRDDFEVIAKNAGAQFTGVWLEAPYKVIYDRAIKRAQGDNCAGEFNNASAVIPDPDTAAQGYVSWQKVDCSFNVNTVVNAVKGCLAGNIQGLYFNHK